MPVITDGGPPPHRVSALRPASKFLARRSTIDPNRRTGGAPSPAANLALGASRGILATLAQTLGSKLTGVATQIALARLLAPRDFGLVALAYTAVAFAGVIRQTGIQQVLIQRHKHFRRWVNPAFWFELTVGFATAILLAASSPIAAIVFHSKAVIGLILVIATAAPLSPWYVIPTARLTIDMRFGAIAKANIAYNAIVMAMSIFLAWRGFGAYSFVLPLPVAGAIRAFLLWRIAKPALMAWPQFDRWPFIIPDIARLLISGFFGSTMFWAGSLCLGAFCTKAAVGQYFLASNLSTQVGQILGQSMASVLLPVLAHLQDAPKRQASALMRASKIAAIVGIPLSLLLAATARPLVLLLYGTKWAPAVPILQILAIGSALSITCIPANTALISQGKFRLVLRWSAIQAAAYLVAVFVGARWAGPLGVAIGSLTFLLLASPMTVALAASGHAGAKEIGKVYMGPAFASAVATTPIILTEAMQSPNQPGLIALSFSCLGMATVYLVLIRLICPLESGFIATQLRGLASRLPPCVMGPFRGGPP